MPASKAGGATKSRSPTISFYMATKTLNDGNCDGDGDGDDSNTHKLNWTASNFDNFVYASSGGREGAEGDRGQHTQR